MTKLYTDWGTTDYKSALTQQRIWVDKRLEEEIDDTLIFTEHYPAFTMGVRKGANKNLLWKKNELLERGISLLESNRGGDITYHGPGQIVGYPIVNLQERTKDLHIYLRDLEDVLISTLAQYGLNADRREGKTGIWIDTRKIAAMGVAVRQWITYHGFALNVNVDLEPFSGIIPCGISQEEGTVTSMAQELGKEIDIEAAKETLAIEFWKKFKNT